MAEQIPYGVTVSLINRLASSAFAEFGRIYGVRDELAKLQETVESINARLLDAEEKQEQDQSHAVKYWISRLKKVLHDADDLFDDFVIEDLREKVDGHGKIVRKVRNFFSGSNPIVFRSNMARKIEAIQKKFNDVANDMFKLNFRQGDRVFKENVSEWRKTSSFVEESEIIGREESKKEVVNLLMQTNSNQNVSLIAVVGVGGLGKTALAQFVYNDAEVQKFFSKQMWVCVSEDFKVETLLKKILKPLLKSLDDKSKVDHLELEELQKEVRQSLSGQRYLLVLDDVWNKSYENWDCLRSSLTSCATGSKILVTTRLEEVAKTMNVSTPYLLGGLSKKQSFTLFKKLAFGDDAKTIDSSLLSIGEKIVEKCGGVPLAIRAIGSLLRTKNGENEWLNILDGDIWRLSGDTQRVMAVLKLSYKHLPIELRQCFAYCCLYQKDSMLEKEELVQLWMAQGYLECSTGMKCMEDVGNDYVKILLMRSFFQNVEMNEYGDIKYFKMHDLMHDLAMDVAGRDCYLHSERKRIVGTPTHLSLDEGVSIPSDLLDANRVRTILWPLGETMLCNDHSPKKELSIIWKFKSLRVVNLCKLDIKELPGSIGRLKHLRYLELSYCRELTRLPENISNLVQLQTLKLEGCSKLEFFAGITKLISLRHLIWSYDCTTFKDGMPAGLGKLKSLQTLQKFVVREDPKFAKLNELKELNNLRGNLCIENLGSIKDVWLESKDVNLKDKKNLRSLELDWGLIENIDSLVLLENLHPPQNLKELIVRNYPGVRYPSWICSLTNIVSISLYQCPHLPRLDQLPFLKHLTFLAMRESDDVWCEYISCFSSLSLPMPISTSFFPSLETLELLKCRQNELIVLPPFPRLSSLSIRYCSQLTCMPTFPHLVEKLELWKCSVKPLIDTVKMNKATLTQEANPKPSLVTNNDTLHSCSFTPLSKLKYLFMRDVDPTGIKELPEEWMQNLISLERLFIELQAPLFRSMRHLPAALQQLTVFFVTDNDDVYEAYKIEEVTTQGQPLHCLRSLQQIEVWGSSYMRELPEWICNIPSLRDMLIFNCLNLESLPEGMGHLTNLQSLQIWASNSNLKERCQRGTGADWPKIAHIPYIYVNEKQM